MNVTTISIIGVMCLLAGVQGALLVSCLKKCRETDSGPDKERIKKLYHEFDRNYLFFVNTISLYPLLGMLGTVISLLTMNSSGDMDALKAKFFTALVTTAAGLCFAIVAKLFHAGYQARIEEHLQSAERLMKRSEGDTDETP